MTLDSSRLEVGSTFSRARLATIVGSLSLEPPGEDSSDQIVNIDGQWQIGGPPTAPEYEGQMYFHHGNGGADDFVTMYVAIKTGDYPAPPPQLPPFRYILEGSSVFTQPGQAVFFSGSTAFQVILDLSLIHI